MRNILVVSLCIAFYIQAFSQEYSFDFDEKLYPNYLHFFPETDNFIYSLKAKNNSTSYIYKIESFELNKVTKQVTHRVIPAPLKVYGRLKIFLYNNKYYFLEANTKENFIQVQSLDVNATQINASKAFIELDKKEKYLTSFQKEDKIFIITGLKKEKLFRVYKITIPTNTVEETEILCPEMSSFLDKNSSRKMIDYNTNFRLSKLVSPNKIYVDDKFLTISIQSGEKEMFYRFNLSDNTYSSKTLSVPEGWFNINSTYYNGNIYRMAHAGRFSVKEQVFYIDIFHFNKEEAFYSLVHQKNNYPFSIQTSFPFTQYDSFLEEKEMLRTLKKTSPIVYPEKLGDSTIIYIGGIKIVNNAGGVSSIPGTTVTTPGGTYTTSSSTIHYGGYGYTFNDNEYILIGTNLNENSLSENEGQKMENIAPFIKTLPKKIEVAKEKYKTKTIDVQRVGDEYYGICFSRKTRKFHYFKL